MAILTIRNSSCLVPVSTTTTTAGYVYSLGSWMLTASSGVLFNTGPISVKAVGQSYIGSSYEGTLGSVELKLYRRGTPDFNLKVYVYQCSPSGAEARDLPTLNLLGVSNVIHTSSIPTTSGPVEFVLDGPVCVGDNFFVVLNTEDVVTMDTANTVGSLSDNTNPFPDGAYWSFTNNWGTLPGADLGIRINYFSLGYCGTDGCLTTTTTTTAP